MLKELNLQEMNEIKGGITRKEYCSILSRMLTPENTEWWSADHFRDWAAAYETHCTWKLEEGVNPLMS